MEDLPFHFERIHNVLRSGNNLFMGAETIEFLEITLLRKCTCSKSVAGTAFSVLRTICMTVYIPATNLLTKWVPFSLMLYWGTEIVM